jgi:microcystin-dependent protein
MEPYVGEIRMFAGNFAPKGWLLCDGSTLAISQFEAFYSVIGLAYGGDGQVTFKIPDLRGRFPMHQGQNPGGSYFALGEIGGTEKQTLSIYQMPAHTHSFNTVNKAATQYEARNGFLASAANSDDGEEVNSYSSDASDATLSSSAISVAGASQPIGMMPPFLAINFIIAWTGVYPSRP